MITKRQVAAKKAFSNAHNFIAANKTGLLTAGWEIPELYRTNKNKGIAHCLIWGAPGAKPKLGNQGQIIIDVVKKNGGSYRQTAFPASSMT